MCGLHGVDCALFELAPRVNALAGHHRDREHSAEALRVSRRRENDLPVTAADVRAAVDAVLAGRPVDPGQRPSIGCGIKWH